MGFGNEALLVDQSRTVMETEVIKAVPWLFSE